MSSAPPGMPKEEDGFSADTISGVSRPLAAATDLTATGVWKRDGVLSTSLPFPVSGFRVYF
jgi:hypothetical protein